MRSEGRAGNNWAAGTSSLNTQSITCNTIRVSSERGVPFDFAPAGGIAHGSTGTQISVACRGSCGSVAANPMDVVVVSDRTGSMEVVDRNAMVNGIRSMLGVMTPAQQFVSLGTIGRSKTTSRSTAACGSGGLTAAEHRRQRGLWVPLKFYDDYLDSSGALNSSSNIAKALTCIDGGASSTGTALAAPLKAAARYVLGSPDDSNNVLSELDGNSRVGEIRTVVIFETDGQPNEGGTANTSTSLSTTADPMSGPDAYTSVQANFSEHDQQDRRHREHAGDQPDTGHDVRVVEPVQDSLQPESDHDRSSLHQHDEWWSAGLQELPSRRDGGEERRDSDHHDRVQPGQLDLLRQGKTAGPGNSSSTAYNSHYISNIVPTTSAGAATSPANTWSPNLSSCRSGSGTRAARTCSRRAPAPRTYASPTRPPRPRQGTSRSTTLRVTKV